MTAYTPINPSLDPDDHGVNDDRESFMIEVEKELESTGRYEWGGNIILSQNDWWFIRHDCDSYREALELATNNIIHDLKRINKCD